MQSWCGYSKNRDIEEALAEACGQFINLHPQCIIFFADAERFVDFTRALHKAFPGTEILGASAYVSFSPAGACGYGLNVAALEGISLATGFLREISTYPLKYKAEVIKALDKLESVSLTASNTCCFILNTAGTNGEELVLDTLAEVLQERQIPVCGGSASSPVILQGEVSLNG